MRLFPFGTVPGSLSDLLGLRLPLRLQSRPAQIGDGTRDSTDELAPLESIYLCHDTPRQVLILKVLQTP